MLAMWNEAMEHILVEAWVPMHMLHGSSIATSLELIEVWFHRLEAPPVAKSTMSLRGCCARCLACTSSCLLACLHDMGRACRLCKNLRPPGKSSGTGPARSTMCSKFSWRARLRSLSELLRQHIRCASHAHYISHMPLQYLNPQGHVALCG